MRLNDFFRGFFEYVNIIKLPYFDLYNFTLLATSAVNYMLNKNEISESEKKDCALYLCSLYKEYIDNDISNEQIKSAVSIIVYESEIDSNFSIDSKLSIVIKCMERKH